MEESHGGEKKPPAVVRDYGPAWRRQLLSPPPSSQQWGQIVGAAGGPISPLAMASAGLQAQESPRLSVQSAMAKAAELRALQAALLQGAVAGSPAVPKSPLGFQPSILSKGSDYPIFTPTYDEEPSSAGHHIRSKSHPFMDSFTRLGIGMEDEDLLLGWRKDEPLPAAGGSCSNYVVLPESSSVVTEARNIGERTESEDHNVVSSCSKCKPAEINGIQNIVHPRPSSQIHQNQRGVMSWLFPRFKRKPKSEIRPGKSKYEEKSQVPLSHGAPPQVSFKTELTEAREAQDSSFSEVCEMRSSLVELKQKLGHLEAYCKELKKALREATQGEPSDQRTTRMTPARSPSPVSQEVMAEGFLQMVSEARVSVKQLCRLLMNQVEESGTDLAEKIDIALRTNHLALNPGYSRELGYHLQALVNRTFYQDFENCVFQKNGAPRILDPRRERLENFSAFVSLRSLSWREVPDRGGSQPRLADLAKFCEQKMASLVGLLDSSGPRGEEIQESFFVAAKCIWLLHLLTFSFSPPLGILRVEEKSRFDRVYMEDVLSNKERPRAPPGRVKFMVAPGFFVKDRVVRCKVLCSRGSDV